MSMLFENKNLPQDTGRLQERWGQGGSKIVNVANTGLTASTSLYTVTTGKKFYVKGVIVVTNSDLDGSYTLNDGSGGSVKISGRTVSTTVTERINYFTFDTPIVFEDSVYFTELTGSVNVNVSMTGWEE